MNANAGTLTITDCVLAVAALVLVVAVLVIWPKDAQR